MSKITVSDKVVHDISVSGNMPNISFIIATFNRGLILYHNGVFKELIYSMGIYGLTKKDDTWFAYCDIKKGGAYVVSFTLDKANNVMNFKRPLHLLRNVHQIDFIDDFLYVTNARENNILVYSDDVFLSGKSNSQDSFVKKIEPEGPLSKSKKHRYLRPDYRHFNSIFRRGKELFIIAHNVTVKTGRKSQVYVYDAQTHKKNRIVDTTCESAHNIYVDDNKMLLCNSIKGELFDLKSNKAVFSCDYFTRGLAIGEDYILVGGSTFSKDRSGRYKSSNVYILDKNYNLVSEVTIPGSQINEIRMCGERDYGMSNALSEMDGEKV